MYSVSEDRREMLLITEWLEDSFVLDKKGFVVTGPDLVEYENFEWPLSRSPLLLDLPRQVHYLLGLIPLTSCHMLSSFQCRSYSLAQSKPGIPEEAGHSAAAKRRVFTP
jgi:hypothetical protein